MKCSMISTSLAAVLLVAAAPTPVLAQSPAATTTAAQGPASAVVQRTASEVLTTLEKRRAEFKANPAALKSFVKTEFDTAFDGNYAGRLVLGIHGRGAAPADISDFSSALADNLTTRYGQALLDFNTNLKVQVKSETPLPGNHGMRVATEMVRETGDPIPVDYLLHNINGQWKIFDVMVEGISYVQTFKNQFDAPLRQSSIKQVAADLRAGRLQAAANTSNNGGR